jgi:hypothetical protein
MIRYTIQAAALRDEIEAHKPGWLARAKVLTDAAKQSGEVADGDAIWSEIKGVYARLQSFKCVYCEKPMPQEEIDGEATLGKGSGEYDVEHYRPKNRVTPWPGDALKAARGIDYDPEVRDGEADGYPRLAFDPENYALSCKTCNSGHKRDHFPIAGATKKTLVRRRTLDAQERPLVMMGLGEGVDDPEAVLGWIGPLPTARAASGHDRLRGRVCIDFFSLDTRSDLLLLRAVLIPAVANVLARLDAATGAEAQALTRELDAYTSDRMYCVACVRAFVALHHSDPALAAQIAAACSAYLVTRDRAVFG